MNKYICIHGHFYQPPRENPWLEYVESQDSAHPYHDWNERVTAECYAPNSLARILGDHGKIVDIVSNYSNISFNFGPTLLSWMEKKDKEIYQAIIDADKQSRNNFSGHGSALAQAYNHMILPLANPRDKVTQIIWGIKDFEYRFGRKPEGMWLPETAVDLESLDIMAEQGIKFTILAPRQAKRVRKTGDKRWRNVNSGKIDPRNSYICHLPSGREMNLFFYDGPISQAVAFEKLLLKGEYLADRILNIFTSSEEDQLVHIATDGETYGHHHERGDMALAYCLHYIREKNLAQITIYGEYLEKHPPVNEVEIFENSSWSCVHGIERWRSNCGCNSGLHLGWAQEWRSPLRGTLDWLRDNVTQIYEQEMKDLVNDPWQARNEYIEVILNRSKDNVDYFLERIAAHKLSAEESVKVLKWLEAQRHAMLMYTSCGWFFDEVSGIETVQILCYAARVIQLVRELTNMPLEETFMNLLEKTPSNIPEYKNAKYIYENFVKPAILGLVRIGAHYAIASLFMNKDELKELYSYVVNEEAYDLSELGNQKLVVGEISIQSKITLEKGAVSFAVFHMGDHNFIGGVRLFNDKEKFDQMHKEIKEVFNKGDGTGTIALIEHHFDKVRYSIWHLFKDEQAKVLDQILESTLRDVDSTLRQINERHSPIIQVIKQLKKTLPNSISNSLSATVNLDITRILSEDTIDFKQLEQLVVQISELSLNIDKVALEFLARKKINSLMRQFEMDPYDAKVIEIVERLLIVLKPLSLDMDFWRAQNIYYSTGKQVFGKIKQSAQNSDVAAQKWIDIYNRLGECFEVWIG